MKKTIAAMFALFIGACGVPETQGNDPGPEGTVVETGGGSSGGSTTKGYCETDSNGVETGGCQVIYTGGMCCGAGGVVQHGCTAGHQGVIKQSFTCNPNSTGYIDTNNCSIQAGWC